MKFILSLLFALTVVFSYAQEKNLTLQKSNDLVYEGNELVDENFVSAEKEYRKAISKAPNNAVGSYNLGNGLFNAGYYDEAMLRHLETVKNATSKKEKHKAFHNIGNVLMKQNLCKEAVEAYKNALRNNPSDDESRYNLALAKECAKQQGDGEEDDDDKKEDEDKKEEEKENEDKKDEGDNNEDQDNEGDDNEDKKDGDDKEDENGKPKDENDNKEENKPGDKKQKKQQQQPGKLSPQQVKNLLEAMNNHEKKVQDKINAKKTKGVKVRTEKDW